MIDRFRGPRSIFNDILFFAHGGTGAKKKRRAWQAKPADEFLDEQSYSFLSFHRRERTVLIPLVILLLLSVACELCLGAAEIGTGWTALFVLVERFQLHTQRRFL